MDDLNLVTYCGLYCGLCAQRSRIPEQASALRDTVVKEGYELWGQDLPNFKEFRAFLERMCDPETSCPGCRQGGGPPFCGIRKCARVRGVEVCPRCPDYPCHRIEAVAQGYPTLVADGQRLTRIGISEWILVYRVSHCTTKGTKDTKNQSTLWRCPPPDASHRIGSRS